MSSPLGEMVQNGILHPVSRVIASMSNAEGELLMRWV